MTHPLALIRDTSTFRPLRIPGRENRLPSLTRLADHWLQEQIHDGVHDSIEDARMALRLYRLKSREWEKHLRNAMQHQDGPAGGVQANESDDEGEAVDSSGSKAKRKGGARKKRPKQA